MAVMQLTDVKLNAVKHQLFHEDSFGVNKKSFEEGTSSFNLCGEKSCRTRFLLELFIRSLLRIIFRSGDWL